MKGYNMKRIIFGILGAAGIAIALTGCSSLEERTQENLDDKLAANNEFKLYQENLDKLDENGNYTGTATLPDGTEVDLKALNVDGSAEAAADPHAGLVRVSFANNNMFTVSYYRDAAHEKVITGSECWLAAGESIYASEPQKTKFVTSNLYEFSRFRVWNIDSDGDYSAQMVSNVGALLTVPEGYSGGGYSIEPVGEYARRKLVMKAYDDETGEEITDVNWYVNDKVYNIGKGVSPTEDYSVKCSISIDGKSNYYVSSTVPATEVPDNLSSEISFPKYDPLSGVDEYTVTVHRFLNARFIGDLNGLIKVEYTSRNFTEWEEITADKDNLLKNLKVGDQIRITVKNGFKLQCVPFASTGAVESDGSHKYTITVGEVSDTHEFLLNICGDNQKDAVRHEAIELWGGKLTLWLDDGVHKNEQDWHEIQEGDYIAPQMRVKVEKVPDEGYHIEEPNCVFKEHVKEGKLTMYMTYQEYLDKVQSDIIEGHPIRIDERE